MSLKNAPDAWGWVSSYADFKILASIKWMLCASNWNNIEISIWRLPIFVTKRKNKPYGVSTIIISILQMSKQRLQETKWLTQSHAVSK